MSSERINFLDLKGQYNQIKDEAHVAIQKVMDITAFAGGPFTKEFEENFATYCEADYAVGVNSGTSALHLLFGLALALGLLAGGFSGS